MILPESPELFEIRRFKKAGGEKLRYEYEDLDQDSIIFDLGGYEGQWASNIFSRYASTLYVFEPVQAYYENIKKRFAKNHKIIVFPFGLGSQDTTEDVGINKESSSIYDIKSPKEKVQLIRATHFITEKKIAHIDLMKINIEGGEYDLLEHLIETGQIKKIKNIQVQFHSFVPNAKDKVQSLRKKLEITHRPTYTYDFVWENWKLK